MLTYECILNVQKKKKKKVSSELPISLTCECLDDSHEDNTQTQTQKEIKPSTLVAARLCQGFFVVCFVCLTADGAPSVVSGDPGQGDGRGGRLGNGEARLVGRH